MTNGCKMMWFFFGSDHGKGPHDKVGVVVKRFLRCEQFNAHVDKLTNVEKVVSFFCKELFYRPESSYTSKRKPFHQLFWHNKSIDVERNSTTYACEDIEGTMKIHSICAMNKNCMTQSDKSEKCEKVLEDVLVEAQSCMAHSNGKLHRQMFRVLYTVLPCSTTRFHFDLSTMHPSHGLLSIVLQSLYMYEWSYNGKVMNLQFLNSLQQATLSHTCLVFCNLAPSDLLIANNR